MDRFRQLLFQRLQRKVSDQRPIPVKDLRGRKVTVMAFVQDHEFAEKTGESKNDLLLGKECKQRVGRR